MKNGFYRIRHDGIIQVAYFTKDQIEDTDELLALTGIWRLTEGYDIFHDDEVKIIEGPLTMSGA